MAGADSRMPQAGAIFVGATRYASPWAWLRLAPRWKAMVKGMKQMPGYLHHQVYFDPPFTLGTVGYFATREDLMVFARSEVHRGLMQWVTDGTTNATGGYIRVYERREGQADADA
ncbi:monooxygenase family protein [Ornithinimicrobium sp. Y1847]|uniref:monooxygenase family protein n=1 Tax=unclassified Ornithinimicrobium TaxID=2615080 RepID=UPI003B680357